MWGRNQILRVRPKSSRLSSLETPMIVCKNGRNVRLAQALIVLPLSVSLATQAHTHDLLDGGRYSGCDCSYSTKDPRRRNTTRIDQPNFPLVRQLYKLGFLVAR